MVRCAMSQHAAVLFANDAFYHAFRNRDMEAMEAVWSERPGVTCIHPGWHPLDGRDAVMQSWQAILSNPDSPQIDSTDALAHVAGDAAYVLCYEVIGKSILVATNIFAFENRTWRMIHHQSGPAPGPPVRQESEDEPSPPIQ